MPTHPFLPPPWHSSQLSIWLDSIYLTAPRFAGNSYTGTTLVAIRRSTLLAGQSTSVVSWNLGSNYFSPLVADMDGPTAPPAGAPAPMLNLGFDQKLTFWKITDNWSTNTHTLSAAITLTPNSWSWIQTVNQKGSSMKLDAMGNRIMNRLAYRNYGTYNSLAVTHTVQCAGTPVKACIRWYEIRGATGSSSPTIYQQGNIGIVNSNNAFQVGTTA